MNQLRRWWDTRLFNKRRSLPLHMKNWNPQVSQPASIYSAPLLVACKCAGGNEAVDSDWIIIIQLPCQLNLCAPERMQSDVSLHPRWLLSILSASNHTQLNKSNEIGLCDLFSRVYRIFLWLNNPRQHETHQNTTRRIGINGVCSPNLVGKICQLFF